MSLDVLNVQDGEAIHLPLDLIDTFSQGGNVRRKRNPKKFAELVESVRVHKVYSSITVRPSPVNEGRFELLAGEGRFKASKECQLDGIPAVVRFVDDVEAMEIMLDENYNREDLGVADEILASKRYMSLYDGDYDEASKRLGWTLKKLKARLALAKLADETLDALDKDQIKLGHAEILSQFTHKTQIKTLPKIINESWTVDTLKQRALSVQKKLSQARFDTTGCQNCEHNSEVQASLFDNNVGGGRCGNSTCWNDKTKTWLGIRKTELENEYGTILYLSEKSEGRQTVSEQAVGAEQFKTGCTGCVSNIVILNDDIGKEGDVMENQCIDNTCFSKCVKALSSANEVKSSQDKGNAKTDSKIAAKKASGKKSKSGEKSSKVAQKTPKAVIEFHQKDVRARTADSLLQSEHFRVCLEVGALVSMAGQDMSRNVDPSRGSASTIATKLMSMSKPEIEKLREDAITTIATKTKGHVYGETSYDEFDELCAKSASIFTEIKDQAIADWKPTTENLKSYLKGGLKSLLTSAEFDKAFNQSNGTDKAPTFDKLMGLKKDDLIQVVVDFPFDWSHFAPSEFIELMA